MRQGAAIRWVLALALAVCPVILAVVYALRDVPVPGVCSHLDWDPRFEAYVEETWWLGVLGQTVALAVLVTALSALRGAGGRKVDHAIALTGAAVILAVWTACLAGEELDQPWYLGLLLGLPAGALVWFVLHVAAGRSPTRLGAVLVVAWSFALPVLGLIVVGIAWEERYQALALIGAALPVAGATAWLAPQLGDDYDSRGWSALAFAAAFVGVLVIPGMVVFIRTLPSPLTC